MPRLNDSRIRQWAANQIGGFRNIRHRYVQYARVLEEVLSQSTKACAPTAVVQARAKSISSFAEKALRKRNEFNNPVGQFTDLCGARVITQTPEEVDAVADLVKSSFTIDWANSVDASKRLRPTEFGYRSVHYIVQMKSGAFPNERVDVSPPRTVYPDMHSAMKAEVQIRTWLEHAWADFSHDRSYKSAFHVPEKWSRELASVAAVLEEADKTFSRISNGLKAYASNYGSYLNQEQMREELRLLEVVLEHERNPMVAARIGKLAIALGEWETAVDVLSRFRTSNYPPLLRDLGIATCKLHRKRPRSRPYKRGQRLLTNAIALACRDTDAIASLAGTWRPVDVKKAHELYRRAFEIDPSDPYPLGNYIEHELVLHKNVDALAPFKPAIAAAARRRRDQADVGMDLPWAYFDIGRFQLLLGEPFESLAAYAKAIQVSTHDWMISTSLGSLDSLECVGKELKGYDWARRLLVLGRAAKFPTWESLSAAKAFRSPDCGRFSGPVVVVAGGCDPRTTKELD